MSPKKRTSLSLDEESIAIAQQRAKALGYDTFSEYVEFLIRRDADDRASHYVVRDESGVRYTTNPPERMIKDSTTPEESG